MKTLLASILLVMLLAVPAAASDVDDNTDVTCDTFSLAVFDGDYLTVKADSVTVYDGPVDPYVTWADSWPKEKRNHRLVVTLDGVRTVFTVRGCR